ncbi:MAG: arsenite methyltransferase [Planctomycetia bacterium]|nr:MAG: arsenite methyltransferase [Planctomycetia bacterium]
MNVNEQTPCCPAGACNDHPTDRVTITRGQAGVEESATAVRERVREGYAQIAQAGTWNAARTESTHASEQAPSQAGCCAPAPTGGGCCGPSTFSPDQLAAAIGYSQQELEAAPAAANMGLSCGNPTAIAALRPGEVVLDLGAGGGFDCFITGAKVGPTGRVIGVDMTAEMIARARRNIAAYRERTGLENVEFRLGEIENLPVADASVDVVISNCVLNLSPDKSRVWREIARVLRPGGRVAVSDLALLQPLPAAVRADVEALVGCVSGAALVDDTRRDIAAAGLTVVGLTPHKDYIDAMTHWEDPLYQRIIAALPPGTRPSDYITSLEIEAVRPK